MISGLVSAHAEVIETQLNGPDDRSGEAVRNHIGLTSDVPDVCGVLRNVRELALLACGPRLGHFGHGEREGLVVNESSELMAFQQKSEVANRQPEAKELSVERTVFTLPGCQLAG